MLNDLKITCAHNKVICVLSPCWRQGHSVVDIIFTWSNMMAIFSVSVKFSVSVLDVSEAVIKEYSIFMGH